MGQKGRNLGFRRQEKALSDEAPGCANKARVCALTAPADGSPSGDSTGQHSPIHEDMESSLKKHTLPHIAPSHQAMLKLLEIAKGWTYFFLKSKMLIAQVWALLSHPGNQTVSSRPRDDRMRRHLPVEFSCPGSPSSRRRPTGRNQRAVTLMRENKALHRVTKQVFPSQRHSCTARSCQTATRSLNTPSWSLQVTAPFGLTRDTEGGQEHLSPVSKKKVTTQQRGDRALLLTTERN